MPASRDAAACACPPGNQTLSVVNRMKTAVDESKRGRNVQGIHGFLTQSDRLSNESSTQHDARINI